MNGKWSPRRCQQIGGQLFQLCRAINRYPKLTKSIIHTRLIIGNLLVNIPLSVSLFAKISFQLLRKILCFIKFSLNENDVPMSSLKLSQSRWKNNEYDGVHDLAARKRKRNGSGRNLGRKKRSSVKKKKKIRWKEEGERKKKEKNHDSDDDDVNDDDEA